MSQVVVLSYVERSLSESGSFVQTPHNSEDQAYSYLINTLFEKFWSINQFHFTEDILEFIEVKTGKAHSSAEIEKVSQLIELFTMFGSYKDQMKEVEFFYEHNYPSGVLEYHIKPLF